MQVWNVLHAARWKCRTQKSPKSRHLCTIVQLCRAISSQLRHVSTIGKKLDKQQYLLQMSPQYGELLPTSSWDRSGSLGHLSYFQRLSRLGSITARQSSSEPQPNFTALHRGRHLCSAGRPSHWALAHILVSSIPSLSLNSLVGTLSFTLHLACKQNLYHLSPKVLFHNKATDDSRLCPRRQTVSRGE